MRILPLFDTPENRLDLETIRADLGDCQRCKLHEFRRNIVFGQGSPTARIMFIGEAPGETEDTTGLAFSGRAGAMLSHVLEQIGVAREDVYIANCLKCRPPGNRDPKDEELAMCRPFLERQIVSVRPRVLVTLGGFATGWLTNEGKVSIAQIRGKLQFYKGIKVVPTFHPAYLLRNPMETKKVIDDIRLAATIAR